jgi:hypothetical protein
VLALGFSKRGTGVDHCLLLLLLSGVHVTAGNVFVADIWFCDRLDSSRLLFESIFRRPLHAVQGI